MAGKYQDLKGLINVGGAFCLNEDSSYPLGNLFTADESFQLRSDSDEQMMFFLPFTATCRIFAVDFRGPTDDSQPTTVKIFKNRLNMSFSDAEDMKPTQTLELSASDMRGGQFKELKFTAFQDVQNLTIFVEENAGGEFSALSGLTFIGETKEGMNIAEWKPCKS